MMAWILSAILMAVWLTILIGCGAYRIDTWRSVWQELIWYTKDVRLSSISSIGQFLETLFATIILAGAALAPGVALLMYLL